LNQMRFYLNFLGGRMTTSVPGNTTFASRSVTPPKLALANLVGLLTIAQLDQLMAKWEIAPLSIFRVNAYEDETNLIN
jgi:hypothetical protein